MADRYVAELRQILEGTGYTVSTDAQTGGPASYFFYDARPDDAFTLTTAKGFGAAKSVAEGIAQVVRGELRRLGEPWPAHGDGAPEVERNHSEHFRLERRGAPDHQWHDVLISFGTVGEAAGFINGEQEARILKVVTRSTRTVVEVIPGEIPPAAQ